MKFSPRLILATLGLLAVSGCGYNQSGSSGNSIASGYHWNSLYREDVQTVAAPIFTNKSYHRGIEFQLTEAVIKQVELRAPYKVVSREHADTIIEGQINQVTMNTISRDYQTNLPREQTLTIAMDLIWKDLRNGQILLQRKNFSRQIVFYPSLGEGEAVGASNAVDKLAIEIVQEMQADW